MAFPTVDEIVARLDFKLEPGLESTVQGYLDDLIVEACHVGRRWTSASMPKIVAKIIRTALVRFLRRPEGYIQSRAGDETLAWAEGDLPAGAPAFTRDELAQIRDAALSGRPVNGFAVVATTPHGKTAFKSGGDPAYLARPNRREPPSLRPGEVGMA